MSYNDYIFGKNLGEGSFGSVSIVTKKQNGKTYALKKVKIFKLSEKEVQCALNEVRLLYSLSHPNIVEYHESFYDEPTKSLNIVMEFCDDGDLAEKIRQNKKKKLSFDETTIWNWALQIIKGISYLHGKHVMHRDLKTANIFLTKAGLVKIGDLNISRTLEGDKKASTQTGTPLYCPPEIWEDLPYDFRCDIWSIGCIIYELATGNPPFTGDSMRKLSLNIINGKYDPIPSRYSDNLKNIIKLMLTVDFKKRPTIEQLLNNEIIVKKMKEIEKINEDFQKTGLGQCAFMKTIKLPKNMKDLNKVLPGKKVVKKKAENEMMAHDEYETFKATMFPQFNKENKKVEPNNKENKKVEPKIPIKPVIKEAPKEKPKEKPKEVHKEKAKETPKAKVSLPNSHKATPSNHLQKSSGKDKPVVMKPIFPVKKEESSNSAKNSKFQPPIVITNLSSPQKPPVRPASARVSNQSKPTNSGRVRPASGAGRANAPKKPSQGPPKSDIEAIYGVKVKPKNHIGQKYADYKKKNSAKNPPKGKKVVQKLAYKKKK